MVTFLGILAVAELAIALALNNSNNNLEATGTALRGENLGGMAGCDTAEAVLNGTTTSLEATLAVLGPSATAERMIVDSWVSRALNDEAVLTAIAGFTPEATNTASATATVTRTPEGLVCVIIPTKTRTPIPSRTSTASATGTGTPQPTIPGASDTPESPDTQVPPPSNTPRPPDTQPAPTDRPTTAPQTPIRTPNP